MTITHDEAAYRRWLDHEVDQALDPTERDALHAALSEQPELRRELEAERRTLEQLHALLRESRIEVREGFADAVYASLPTAPWERRRGAWWLPVAMLVVFGVAASLLIGSAGGLASGPFGTVMALGDFFQTAVLAGAGLVGVTWQGFGIALDELLAASKLNAVAFGIGVLCLNLLFFRLLRRARAARSAVHGGGDDR